MGRSSRRPTGVGQRRRDHSAAIRRRCQPAATRPQAPYACTNCGYELQVESTKSLPPCPSCGNGEYRTKTGGDAADDPYPNR